MPTRRDCCNCDCPTCQLRLKDGCAVSWECGQCGEPPTGATISLVSDSYDFGEVEPTGSVAAVMGDQYTLTVRKAGCSDRTYTLTVTNDCPCVTGCVNPGRVLGAKTTATITVRRFGAYTQVQSLPPFYLGCAVTRNWDFTALNHTASFEVKQLAYVDENGANCYADYIDPQEYYIADTTVTESWSDGYTTATASVTYAVYGVIESVLSAADGTTPIGWHYHLKFVRTSSSPFTGTICTGASGTFYAGGDTADATLEYGSYHCDTIPPDYLTCPYAGCGCFDHHYQWCALSNKPDDDGQEISTWGVPEWMGVGSSPGLLPPELRGIFQWDSIL